MGKVNVEFKKVVKEINTLYKKLKVADRKSGKDRYDLGSKLKSLKDDKRFHGFGNFDDICKERFGFTRVNGYKLIWMYEAQKALHDAALMDKETHLGSSMLMMLWKSHEPCKIWELACKKAGNNDPSEAIVSQIIDEQNKQKTTSNEDMSSVIANATPGNVLSVLQKIKNRTTSRPMRSSTSSLRSSRRACRRKTLPPRPKKTNRRTSHRRSVNHSLHPRMAISRPGMFFCPVAKFKKKTTYGSNSIHR